MIKPLFNLFIILLLSNSVSAQIFPYGNYSQQEVNMKKYDADTAAHAVILNEYGTSNINVVSDDYIKIIYEYHVKIKIFDAKGFDKGTVEIPFYSAGNDSWEDVSEIKGITTYKDDNGNIQTAELAPSKIVTVKENKYWSNKKFAMPNLRSGAVIEYQYRLVTPY